MTGWLLIFMLAAQANSAVHITAAARLVESGERAYKQRDYDEASGDFKKAIGIEPTFSEAFDGLIQTYLAAGENAKAAEWITKFLQIDPGRKDFRLTLGNLLLKGNQAQRALAQFATVLKQDAGNADALFGFAQAAKRCGMNDRAAEAMSRGKRLHPEDPRFQSSVQ